MLRASNQMNDFLESGRASRGGEGRESPQSSRKCLAKAMSASSVSGGVVRHMRLGISFLDIVSGRKEVAIWRLTKFYQSRLPEQLDYKLKFRMQNR